MKTVSKKLLCLLMVVFLLAAAIPVQAFAASAGTYDLELILKREGEANPIGTKTITGKNVNDSVNILGAFNAHFPGQIQDDDTVEFVDQGNNVLTGEQTFTQNTTITGTIKAKTTAPTTIDVVIKGFPGGDKTLTGIGRTAEAVTQAVNDALGSDAGKYEFTVPTIGADATSIDITLNAKAVPAKITVTITDGTNTLETFEITGKNVGDTISHAELESLVKGKNANYTPTAYSIEDNHAIANQEEAVTVTVTVATPKPSEPSEPSQPSESSYTLTFDAYGGKVNGNDTVSRKLKDGEQIGELPKPTLAGYTFMGWYTDPTGGSEFVTGAYNYKKDMTVYARWSVNAKELEVFRVLNGSIDTAKSLFPNDHLYVPENWRVLDYLREKVAPTMPTITGYTWDGLWRDYALKELTQQDTTMQESYTAYAIYNANKYTITFEANGGKVDPASMEVTFDKKVGTLPTPTKDGQVFKGWYDNAGNRYTADTIYKEAGNITLYAKWDKEAFVLVRFYLNGDTKSVHRIMDMTKYVEGDNITREAVEKIVKKFYSAQSGKELRADGLFTASTWADYVKNTSKKGTPTVQIKKDEPTYVYVMVRNAKEGGSSSTTSTKPVDKTNPKTGDTMLIYTAASVMVLAGAALLTVQAIRKRKQF